MKRQCALPFVPFVPFVAFALTGSPAPAASGDEGFLVLSNTDFVVALSFLLFIAVAIRFGLPGMLTGMLDKRAEGIRADLDEARKLREEAQTLLASYERKQEEVKDQAGRIIAHAKAEAGEAGEQAKADLKAFVARRLQAAGDQIASAEAAAIREVRDRAIAVAVGAAGDVIAGNMTAADASGLIDASISDVEARLH